MNRIVLLTLLALLLSGCRITTVIVGEGTVTSQSGNFNCTTGNVGACNQDYATAGSEVFVATPAPGWTFAKWTNCNYVSILSCDTSFNQDLANGTGAWTVTATFKPTSPPIQAASYTYNGLGQRITKTVAGVTTLFQYDLEGNLIAELNSSGQSLRQHIHINNEPIAQLTRKTDGTIDVQYVHTDHLGTPTLLTNQSGKVVADIEATPFGETYVDYAEVEYNKRFPGQYKDAETGLHYNYFRDYDPTIGRYIQSDPIGLGGGLNTYAYAGGNPVKHRDLFGLDITVCHWGGSLPHIGYGVNTNQTLGKRVREDASALKALVPLGVTVPGEVSNDHMSDAAECKNLSTTKEQDEQAKRLLNMSMVLYQEYNLYTKSCVDFVRDSLSDVLNTTYSDTNMPGILYREIK